jgi:hypothetical protein
MNPLVLEMITAHAGATGNTALIEMLTRLSSGAGAAQDPLELLAQYGGGNPLVNALAKHYSEMQAKTTSGVNTSVIDVEPDLPADTEPTATPESADYARVVADLQQQLEQVSAELQFHRERCDLLATALGACCLCWGQDPACRACRGRGRPGFTLPDETLVKEFLLPAIKMLRAQKASANGAMASVPRKTVEAGA